MLEYWGAEEFGRTPTGVVSFKFKMDTDLYDLAKAKTRPCSISFSPDGKSMAVTSRDKQVCLVSFSTRDAPPFRCVASAVPSSLGGVVQ